jgi:putative effector of murein hydrolase LrgA (UPF0299 family)
MLPKAHSAERTKFEVCRPVLLSIPHRLHTRYAVLESSQVSTRVWSAIFTCTVASTATTHTVAGLTAEFVVLRLISSFV